MSKPLIVTITGIRPDFIRMRQYSANWMIGAGT